ncbi:MAG: SIR2 family protein, partial [Pseudomonadota bacterium]
MAESQFSDSLIERIRNGRAALVVGSNIGALAGMPSWKKVLERLRDDLDGRGQPGDKEAAENITSLLKKGRLVSALGFLARTLGSARCDVVLAEAWKTPDPLPAAIQVLGRIPIKSVWTVHPGDLVEQAIRMGSLEGWPEPRVASYEDADALDARRRYVLSLLGNVSRPGSYVVIPTSVRRALTSADAYRQILQETYQDGALILVGFRHGDPDLIALLDRIFSGFEVPRAEHYFVGAGLGPVDIEELKAEHHMTVVPLEGQGGDEKSAESLALYLSALIEACERASVSLATIRPAADDLEGWAARLHDDSIDVEAKDALLAIEQRARTADQPERIVEALLARMEAEQESTTRAALLKEIAGIFEKQIGDLPRAFTALTAALKEDPGDEETLREAERMAAETDGWGELVADVSAMVQQLDDKVVAAALWMHLGRWYSQKLHHYDYAASCYREAIRLEPTRVDARDGLEEIYRKQLRWGELAQELVAHAEVEPEPSKRVDVLLALGDLYETQLASTAKALGADERIVGADPQNTDALAALERLYRRGERWGKLVAVLEQRAVVIEADDPAQAVALRKELAV